MTNKVIRVFSTMYDLNQAAANHFDIVVRQAVQSRGEAHVVLSGGSTPLGLYQLLTQAPYQTSIPWAAIHFYWGDERSVPPDHLESNFGQARKTLLDHVPIRENNIHRIQGKINPEDAASAYVQELAKYPNSNLSWPQFDWTLLGLGEDGHTASLFPGDVNPDEKIFPVISFTADYQERPASRVTLTPKIFNTSWNIVFMVTGANKAKVLSSVLNGPYDPINLPAQRIQPANGTITWLLDTAASQSI